MRRGGYRPTARPGQSPEPPGPPPTNPASITPAVVHTGPLDPRLRALGRLLVDSGDMTPQGQRMLEAVLDEHRLPVPKMTRRTRRAALLRRLGRRGEDTQP